MSAQTDKPLRLENDRYRFAFTFESNSLLTFEEDGNGFSCIHNPAGGGKNTKPDYGLLVYGTQSYVFSGAEAKAAGFDQPQPTEVFAEDLEDNEQWTKLFTSALSAHDKWDQPGEAVVKVEGGASVKAPYFTWSRTAGGKTRYAMMYVMLHGDAFIHFEAESSRPFSKQQEAWFTTRLELLKAEDEPHEHETSE